MDVGLSNLEARSEEWRTWKEAPAGTKGRTEKKVVDAHVMVCNARPLQSITIDYQNKMYSKLFGKILDSSIWLEDLATRVVWITLLVAMDEDGYAHFSSIRNLASRARVTDEECQGAVEVLTSPDKDSGDKEFEGRRIERVPGGFMILNARKYRDLAKRHQQLEQNRQRVTKFRETKSCNASALQAITDPLQSITEKSDSLPPVCVLEDVLAPALETGKGTGEGAFASRAAELELQKQGPPGPAGEPDDGAPPLAEALKVKIGTMFTREPGIMWDYSEESRLVEICIQRARTVLKEFGELEKFKKRLEPQDLKFHFPGTVLKLLEGWSGYLDKARNYVPDKENGGNPRNKGILQNPIRADETIRKREERERARDADRAGAETTAGV